MLTSAKQAKPNRCYCRVHDEGVNLNDIAKIITTLNHKTLLLRNEVNAFKNVDANGENKLSEKLKSTRERLSASNCERQSDIFRRNVKLDHLTIPEESKSSQRIERDLINKETLNNTVETNNLTTNKICQNRVKNNTYCNRVYEIPLKIRKKKVSRGTQCYSAMERKGKRHFFNCFKTESPIREYKLFQQNKKVKSSSKNNIHVTFDLRTEENESSSNRINDENMFKDIKRENYENDQSLRRNGANGEDKLNKTLDWTFESVKIEPKTRNETLNQFKKLQGNNIFKAELVKNKAILQKDTENEHETFESLEARRLGGGAELRGNRLISDFNNKICKINLYKNVKFDAKNVKKRLDACISELNGIIEDVSLIFPDTEPKPNPDLTQHLKRIK